MSLQKPNVRCCKSQQMHLCIYIGSALGSSSFGESYKNARKTRLERIHTKVKETGLDIVPVFLCANVDTIICWPQYWNEPFFLTQNWRWWTIWKSHRWRLYPDRTSLRYFHASNMWRHTVHASATCSPFGHEGCWFHLLTFTYSLVLYDSLLFLLFPSRRISCAWPKQATGLN